jgi:hypothetical protein
MAVICLPRLRTAVLALLVVAASSGAAARLVRAQSLADVAKKEEERRKAVPAPAKVYTNKDLSAPPAGSPPPSSGTSSSTASTAPTDSPKDAKGSSGDKPEKEAGQTTKDEKYWSGRLKELRDKLDRDTSFADALQTKVNSLTADFVNRDDPAQRAIIERDRQKALAQLTTLQKDIATDKKAIADLLEEARRAGVPPGWLR